jgi:putative ABC transport system permease protein
MNLNIGPICSSLTRNRAGSLLVVLQIAIALAVLSNAAWIVHQRIENLSISTGIDDQNIFALSSSAFNDRFNYEAAIREDLAYLRGLTGVVAASPADAVPFSQMGFSTDIWTNPNQKGTPEDLNAFSMDEQGLRALGGRLVAGREFRADEIEPPLTPRNMTDFVPVVIVTAAVAQSLYPGKNPLGATVYDSAGKPATIIGIADNMIGSALHGLSKADHAALFPRLPEADEVIYVVRTEPGRRDRLMAAAETHLARSNPNRVINYARPLDRFKRRLYLADSNMQIFLTAAAMLVLLATCLGIYGLATFNVSTRTRQIGTRRALGARKRDILQYFLVEIGLLTAAGIVLGSALALFAGYWLSSQYALPPLDLRYLFSCIPLLWMIGQLAAWYPARRASSVQPSVATRTT